MALVNFPYRWRWHTILGNLHHAWWDLRQGVTNLVRWAPVAWSDHDWDADFLLIILEWKLLRMAKCFEKYGTTADSERNAKTIRVCVALCRRLINAGDPDAHVLIAADLYGSVNHLKLPQPFDLIQGTFFAILVGYLSHMALLPLRQIITHKLLQCATVCAIVSSDRRQPRD
jgi:hypothetical protein